MVGWWITSGEPGFFRSVGLCQSIACMVVEEASRTKQRELAEIQVGS